MTAAERRHMDKAASLSCVLCGSGDNEMIEVWVPAKGFGGYEVSSFGNIRSIDRIEINCLGRIRKLKGKPIRQQMTRKGYMNVELIGKTYRAHRVVATSFFAKELGEEVNHKNGIRHDNRIENLELCTRSENQKHAYSVLGNIPYQPCKGKFGADHHGSKPVIARHIITNEEIIYEGLHDAQRITGLDKSNISAACRGKQKSCGGYVWSFLG